MYDQNALQQYQSTRVETGRKEGLIVMLYEGAIRFAREAGRAINESNIQDKGTYINKATRIIHELSAALDHEVGGEVSQQLEKLYEYVDFKLSYAHATNEARAIEEAVQVLEVLLESWKQIAEAPDTLPQETSESLAVEQASLSVSV